LIVIDRVRQYIRRQRLLQPGDRVAVAISGGADSVALLRILLELRPELGIVLSAAHFHHGIRGAEADSDQRFVCELAGRFGLELHTGTGDVPAHARVQKSSLETAAREMRHRWFVQLVREGKADKVATAHTLDDQAETVLMRLLRGTGSRGLAGIFPVHEEKSLVRPLLTVTRREVETYLKSIGQAWREDSTNQDLRHTRNRIRHELIPMLERNFNPAIRHTLADLAQVSLGEAEYWRREAASLLPRLVRPGKPSRSGRTTTREAAHTLALDLAALAALPLALQRQVLHEIGRELGIALEFTHIQQLTELILEKLGSGRVVLPGGLTAARSFRELRFTPAREAGSCADYQYSLQIPGEIEVPELGTVLRARLVSAEEQRLQGYNANSLLDRGLLAPELTVRNWRAGDRFFPAKTRSPKKLKELLQSGRLGQQLSSAQRKAWPVVESSGQIVWVRGWAVPEAFVMHAANDGVLIEEIKPELQDG
jgi:tRNA(Ile)-lysidine synthase